MITQTFAMLGGFALACLLLNTPGRDRRLLRLQAGCCPGCSRIGAALMDWFDDLAPWIDFQSAQTSCYDVPLTGEQWAHLVV